MATDAEQVAVVEAQRPAPAYTLRQLVGYALGLGTWGFGGPVALVGYMHRDLVEQRKWISEAEYKEGLTLAQIMPGPFFGSGRSMYSWVWAQPQIMLSVAISFLMVVVLSFFPFNPSAVARVST